MRKIDDKIIISVMLYVFIVSLVGSVLPSDLFQVNPSSERFNQDNLIDDYNRSYDGSAGVTGQISWFRKILTVLFVPFAVPGIPLALGAVLAFMNYVSAFLAGIYIYDKIRGI